MSAALSRHGAILSSAIEHSGGYTFKTMGDAFCAAFPTPLSALHAALDAQRARSVRAKAWLYRGSWVTISWALLHALRGWER
jgi:class 3 adenylate cyclase